MKNTFTRTFLFGLIFTLSFCTVYSQNATGLQNIIVEKYYVSNADDAAASMGTLPVGSVTYRIFVDMKQGYKFQAAYGLPYHTLYMRTTTSFFNNEDRGASSPTYTKSQAKSNTVMLDSWLTVGAACAGNFGILKSEDDGVATVISDGVLKNADPMAGIPLTVQDGLISIAGLSPQPITFVGPQVTDGVSIFDATSQAGGNFTLTNGAWSALYGAVGTDTTNKVLIAQMTTDGDFSFELNMQLGTPSLDAEKFVAKDPLADETQKSFLTYNSIHVGLNEPLVKNTNANIVSVFPNPTSTGKFTLNIESENNNPKNQLTIYNLIGKVVLKKNIDNASGKYSEKIDLSESPGGMYFIEVLIDGHKSISKLVKN